MNSRLLTRTRGSEAQLEVHTRELGVQKYSKTTIKIIDHLYFHMTQLYEAIAGFCNYQKTHYLNVLSSTAQRGISGSKQSPA